MTFRRTQRTPEKGERLLKKLALGYSVAEACRAEAISRTTFYEWKRDEPDFAKDVDNAIEEGTDRLEDIARKRAIDPKNGSDTLLIFLLKGRRPEKYRERASVEHTGADGAPLVVRMIRHHEPEPPAPKDES